MMSKPLVWPVWPLLVLLLGMAGCDAEPEPARPRKAASSVSATVVSFRVVSRPDGAETIERIAVSESGKVRLPDETVSWRLFDIPAGEVIVVDELDRVVRRESFDEVLTRLRQKVRQSSEVPPLRLERLSGSETVGGYEARPFRFTMGRGYERELWISQRTLVHSDLFLLRLATDPIDDEDLPSLRPVVELLDELDGYPVVDLSRMTFDGVGYEIERRLIAVSTQNVPASWFQIPEWDPGELKESRAGRQPAASPLAGQNARGGGSRPSGSDRTAP